MAAGGERGVMCRTMHKNYFKKDSPVPYFRLFFVLTPKYDDTLKNTIQQRSSKVKGGREWQQEVRRDRLG